MLDTTSVEVLGFDPKDHDNIYTIPLITRGCDSIYSWDSKFRHMWHEGDEEDLAHELIMSLPNYRWVHPKTGQPIIFSLTGGEPTLRAKTIPALLNYPTMSGLKLLLIETNCSVPLSDKFMNELNDWTNNQPGRKVIWSNSPKLSVSGEPFEKAICPDVAIKQLSKNLLGDWKFEQYFKFVCGPDDNSFNEVSKAMEAYYDAGVPRDIGVFIMPMACQQSDQSEITQRVAEQCIERGYTYCHRVHLEIWGNVVGT
jgi:organic radical activating enzyme